MHSCNCIVFLDYLFEIQKSIYAYVLLHGNCNDSTNGGTHTHHLILYSSIGQLECIGLSLNALYSRINSRSNSNPIACTDWDLHAIAT